ncbi:MAG: bifunctional phosphopantothenoylcysteine decarboxylase/phosphopantothenate--cysteine ligase CoaBC [Cytophagales bacterium]|nr:bifunctional phosphopantothenoylcysteine decarboxylase/phosphopantothenate--cysteine ligase CoaBC [Cytophagales bacterium]
MSTDPIKNKHIVLGLSGGIAAYKAAELCRALVKAGASVQVVMTEAATQFMTALTMQALSGREVFTSQWDSKAATDGSGHAIANNMAHINLTRGADAVLIAPASADFMAKLLHGRADDLLSLLCLAKPSGVPLILAPAMNREMWAHPATQRNMAQLKADGAHLLDVGNGDQACGEVGDGRMLEANDILSDLVTYFTPKVLAGKRALITAGPTYEAIDPVRGITNLSSGKMGFAIAEAMRDAGCEVTLVAGRTALDSPRGVQTIPVISANDMLKAVQANVDNADIFIATAAVADWRPANAATHKIKKDGSGKNGESAAPILSFVENTDILATVAASPRATSYPLAGSLYCVGFAAESEHLEAHARAKRERKGVPLLVGNIGPATFGMDDNALLLVDANGTKELPRAAKIALARALVLELAQRLNP